MVAGTHESGAGAEVAAIAVGEAAGAKLWSLVGEGCSHCEPAVTREAPAERMNFMPSLFYLPPNSYEAFPTGNWWVRDTV